MESSPAQTILASKATLAAVAVLTAVLFLFANLPWELDDYDQAQQAFTSFEMIKEGHWFYQRTPHEHIAQKPPFVGWASAVFFTLTRSWNVAWRLPSFLCAVALAVMLFRIVALAYGAIPALIGFSAFSLNLLTVRLATLVRTDMPLALAIFLIGMMIFEKVRKREAWTARDQCWFFALITASMWIKGPFVYLLVLPAVVLFQWRYRRSEMAVAWCGWWPWAASLAVFLTWVIGGIHVLPRFYHEVVAFEFLDRLDPTVHRAQPVYFYLLHLLHQFAPWSILMIALAVLSARRSRNGIRGALAEITPETFWLISWSLSGFFIMSLIPSKRADRVFPVVPPLCLLLSAQVARNFANGQVSALIRRWTAATLIFAIMFASVYATFKVVSAYRDNKDAFVNFSRAVSKSAAAHHWRYEVVWGSKSAGSTEGMLLYLQKLHFIKPEEAVRKWNDREVDALVVPAFDAPQLIGALQGAAIALRTAQQKNEPANGFVLVTRLGDA